MKKALIIRFSAFGDIIHCLYAIGSLKKRFPELEVDFLTREDFRELVGSDPLVNQIISFRRRQGLKGLWSLAGKIVASEEAYDLIYDAHNSLRSKLLKIFCLFRRPFGRLLWITRPKNRWKRLMLFTFRRNYFPTPFKAMLSYVRPLERIGVEETTDKQRTLNFPSLDKKLADLGDSWIACAPSAAWEMKRWPVSHWKELIKLLPEYKVALIGGPQDQFCEELVAVAPDRVVNFAGKLSLIESCSLVQKAPLLVSADTGAIHVADILGRPGISLIGPTAFGFPTSSSIITLEVDLPCRPCSKDGRGDCSQAIYQKCMVEIKPEVVAQKVQALFPKSI